MSKEKKDHVDYCLLGQRVRRARMKLNLTQEVLAEKVGVSIPTISHIETGTNKVSLELFVSIANALNVTPDELIMDLSLIHICFMRCDIGTDQWNDVYYQQLSEQPLR